MTKIRDWIARSAPGDLALLLFVLMIPVSLLVSPLPARSLSHMAPLVSGVVVYYVLSRCRSAALLHWVWWGLILAGCAIALLAPPATFPPSHPLWRWLPGVAKLRKLIPDTFNENVIAGTLVVLLPFGLARILARGRCPCWIKWGQRLVATGVSAVIVLILAMTSSRGGYVAAAAACLALCALLWPRLARWVVPLLVMAALITATRLGWGRVADVLLKSSTVSGLDERVEIWGRALLIMADFPLTGLGLGCFEPVVALLYPLFSTPAGTVSHAHNLFFQVAVDLGLPGLVAYLALLGLALYAAAVACHTLRRRAQQDLLLLSAACLASLVGLCAHGLIDATTWDSKGAFLAWAVLGLAMALYRQQDERGMPT